MEAKVDGEVVKRSKETFILADDSKFGAVAFSVICELEEIDYMITNKKIDSSLPTSFLQFILLKVSIKKVKKIINFFG